VKYTPLEKFQAAIHQGSKETSRNEDKRDVPDMTINSLNGSKNKIKSSLNKTIG
jgi:hypothetical protein